MLSRIAKGRLAIFCAVATLSGSTAFLFQHSLAECCIGHTLPPRVTTAQLCTPCLHGSFFVHLPTWNLGQMRQPSLARAARSPPGTWGIPRFFIFFVRPWSRWPTRANWKVRSFSVLHGLSHCTSWFVAVTSAASASAFLRNLCLLSLALTASQDTRLASLTWRKTLATTSLTLMLCWYLWEL